MRIEHITWLPRNDQDILLLQDSHEEAITLLAMLISTPLFSNASTDVT